jgi:hypothetical protein
VTLADLAILFSLFCCLVTLADIGCPV